MSKINPEFIKKMAIAKEFNAWECLNCGACTAFCPTGINLLPRKLFRYVLMGMDKKIMENEEAIYSCLLCKMCEDNCPAGVKIAENIRAIRVYLGKNVYAL